MRLARLLKLLHVVKDPTSDDWKLWLRLGRQRVLLGSGSQAECEETARMVAEGLSVEMELYALDVRDAIARRFSVAADLVTNPELAPVLRELGIDVRTISPQRATKEGLEASCSLEERSLSARSGSS